MSKSFILYLHNDLSGNPDWKKLGKAMTPYSAVRSRQKNCSEKFYLNHVFLGDPVHIDFLEETFKRDYYVYSGTHINKISGQTELFKMSEDAILLELSKIIENYKLHIKKVELDHPYSACNSGECPLNIPSEANSYSFLRDKIIKTWGVCSNTVSKKMSRADSYFNLLFEPT
jgi:hypothetical protein